MGKPKMVPCVAMTRVNDAMPGEETEVPEDAYAELVKQGVIRAIGSEEPVPPASEPSLVDLIGQIPEDDPELWTDSGKPTTQAFKALFDLDVTAQERDDAWAAFSDPD